MLLLNVVEIAEPTPSEVEQGESSVTMPGKVCLPHIRACVALLSPLLPLIAWCDVNPIWNIGLVFNGRFIVGRLYAKGEVSASS